VPTDAANHILATGGGVLRQIGGATQTQPVFLPALPNFDERVLRVVKIPGFNDPSCSAVATAAVQISSAISDMDKEFVVNSRLDYPRNQYQQVQMPVAQAPRPVTQVSPPVEEAKPKSRIETLRDQLLKMAKVEQGTRLPEPATTPAPAASQTQAPLKQHDAAAEMQREWVQQQTMENLQANSRLVDQFIRNQIPPPPSEIVMANSAILEMLCVVKMPQVPNKFCSAIIGTRGANVREIQDASGAKIKVQDEGRSPHKDIAVTGEVHQVHAALLAICEIMLKVDLGVDEHGIRDSTVSQWLRSTRDDQGALHRVRNGPDEKRSRR
jgi:hypothetical protein